MIACVVREFGTVYPPHCGSLTLNLDTLNHFERHFCLARPQHISDILILIHRVYMGWNDVIYLWSQYDRHFVGQHRRTVRS